MLKVTRALLSEPKLVLLDEISEGLQPLVIDRVRACLAAERQRGVSILLIEQNIDFVWHLAQRYGLMGAGRVLGQGMFTDPDARERVTAHLAI
jgi:branched-chain amino acid transport system ATP-binding protein